MIQSKRGALILGLAAFCFTLWYLQHTSNGQRTWRAMPQVIGLGELVEENTNQQGGNEVSDKVTNYDRPTFSSPFMPGQAKPPGSNYTRNLVIAKTQKEEADWLERDDLAVNKMIYVVDDRHSKLRVPKNKGHEVMVYLTYIIDHYDELPDVSIFMHSHQFAWHQNDLLNSDASEMVKRLSSERVMREGYMNLRCHWMPGCPDWMHPGTVEEDHEKKEETLMAQAWAELFPNQPIPEVLGGACCAQFALSRGRIQSIAKQTYVYYREWMLRTKLEDKMSGRVWEYLWQYVFTGKPVACPNQWSCYCDGFGVCFEDERSFDYWFELQFQWRNLCWELEQWHGKAAKVEEYRQNGNLVGIEGSNIEIPEPGKNAELTTKIRELEAVMEDGRQMALQRGRDPKFRAWSAGRQWKEGDGF